MQDTFIATKCKLGSTKSSTAPLDGHSWSKGLNVWMFACLRD